MRWRFPEDYSGQLVEANPSPSQCEKLELDVLYLYSLLL